MKCPVPCDRCGELIELDAAHFYVFDWCNCMQLAACSHGLCDACFDVVEDEAAEEQENQKGAPQ